MNLSQFVEYNFPAFVGVVFQFLLLIFNINFSKKERRVFSVTLALEIFELVTYNLEIYFSTFSEPTVWRTIMSIAGYITRPALVYPFIVLLRSDSNAKWGKLKYLDLIPLIVTIIIQQLAFGTELVFWYDAANIFHRGPLGYVSHGVTIFYLLEASLQVATTKKYDRKVNIPMITAVLLYVIFAMIFESFLDIRSLGISSGVFSIVFFMFSLQSNYLTTMTKKLQNLSEIDYLSNLYNRYAGEKRINDSLTEKNTGVFCIIDIDRFKHVNDTFGHAAGDNAIVSVANAIKAASGKDDIATRLGGDEFAVFFPAFSDESQVNAFIDALISNLQKVVLPEDPSYRLTVSFGLATAGEELSSFDALYRSADVKLYDAKKRLE